ncbi:MAG: NAD+ synthase [Candidatus Krumholzibacteriia bacterium]|nr:NAD+ synthase [bacterium]MCB9514048.1 NAD+ synthase [Candidatus Latescibacterota bacterium]MCB9515726.1 NAD+ synthase [Candidatus Latescibacterota bacterium]
MTPGATPAGPWPGETVDHALLRKILVQFIRSEVRRTGLERGVLGLSGGLDSSLVAALAAEALGPERVLGLAMPYRSSSPESLAHARLIAEQTGIRFETREITPMVDAYFAAEDDASSLRRGNKMARERMSILYDRSASEGALVLGTSNKSEIFLGYGTAFGDLASAVNPIGDLYKTQVRALSRFLGLPAAIVDKAPSADLWAGQSDEQELGFSYAEVDPLLYAMLDERLDRDALLARGWEAAFVDRVTEMIRRSQFKRRLPVIAKVSRRTADRDFLYPRDWGSG